MKKTLTRLFRTSTSSSVACASCALNGEQRVTDASSLREFSGQEMSGIAGALLASAQVDAVLASMNSAVVPAGLAERIQAQVRGGFVAEESRRQQNASTGSLLSRIFPTSIPAWRQAGMGAFALAACLVVASWAGGGQVSSSFLRNHGLVPLRSAAAPDQSATGSATAQASTEILSNGVQSNLPLVGEGGSSAAAAPTATGSTAALDILARNTAGRSFGAAGAQSLAPAPLRAGARRGRVQRQALAGRAMLSEGKRGSAGVHVLPGGQPLSISR